jgi:membrane fusion protein, multidrug efflux system
MTVGNGDADTGRITPIYSGVILPRIESAVGFRVAGRIIDRKVDVGDAVVEGAVLGTLDPTPYRLAIDAARSAVVSAEAERAQAASDFNRLAPLAAKGIIAIAQIDKLRTSRDTTQARLNEAQSKLDAARDDLTYASLKAPSAGIITEILVEAGQNIVPGQVAFRIAKPGSLEAVIDVPETVVTSVKAGTTATIELLADPGKFVTARVREVAPSADPATRTYRVRAVLDDPNCARIGMTARVRLDVAGSREQSIETYQVPMAAVFHHDKQTAVWVIKSDGVSLELRPVTVASFNTDGATVTGGIHAGERIVTAGVHRLDATQAVRIWEGQLP